MNKKFLKIVLIVICIILVLGLLVFSMTQTIEAKRQSETAIKQQEIADKYYEMFIDLLDTSKTGDMLRYFSKQIDSLENEIIIRDSIIDSYQENK